MYCVIRKNKLYEQSSLEEKENKKAKELPRRHAATHAFLFPRTSFIRRGAMTRGCRDPLLYQSSMQMMMDPVQLSKESTKSKPVKPERPSAQAAKAARGGPTHESARGAVI
jgi:hypothetical protein